MYLYFASGLLAGVSFMAFLLIKELYSLNKRNQVQANQIARLEKLNQMLATQVSEERIQVNAPKMKKEL
jgi:hypothetical protein